MAARLSVWIAFVGMKVLLLSQWAVSKRTSESEAALSMMTQSTKGEDEAVRSLSSDEAGGLDSLDTNKATKGWKACKPHCHDAKVAEEFDWDTKCTWKKCQACSECSGASGSGGSSGRSKGSRGATPDTGGPFAEEAGPWAMGGDNKDECPPRYERVEDESECRAAAGEIGGTLGFQSFDDPRPTPQGCYREGSGYYLNVEPPFAPRSGTSPVCKRASTYCPPDVESYCKPAICGDAKWDKEHCPTTCNMCEDLS
jgi:hypothetical protein